MWQFVGWILFELVGMTFFVALYLDLMSKEGSPDFITFLRHHIAHNDNQRVT